MKLYSADYLREMAAQYQPPTTEEIIQSLLDTIMMYLKEAAGKGIYRYSLSEWQLPNIFQTKEIALGIFKNLSDLQFRITVSPFVNITDGIPHPASIEINFDQEQEPSRTPFQLEWDWSNH